MMVGEGVTWKVSSYSIGSGSSGHCSKDTSGCKANQECINVVSTLIAIRADDLSYCSKVKNLNDDPARDLCQAVLTGDKLLCAVDERRQCERQVYGEADVFQGQAELEPQPLQALPEGLRTRSRRGRLENHSA